MTAIVAMAENRVIGAAGKIPWHIPDDLKFFKRTTMGHTIVMGRKTFASIGRPLPGRRNIVISRSMVPTAAFEVADSPGAVVEPADGSEVFVIGGEQIYAALLPRCGRLLVTHVPGHPDGDTYFPEFEHAFHPAATLVDSESMRVVEYLRG